jgi:linoleoyl-CoA desaturase
MTTTTAAPPKASRPTKAGKAVTPVKGQTMAQAYGLSEAQLEELGQSFDAIRARITAELGEEDVEYIRRVIRWQRGCEVAGRASLFLGWLPPFWLLGATALSVSKILDNMEIGHNIMHGQYDWTRDPTLSAHGFEWDTACPGDQWRHSHNYLHHTFTNIVGKDRDLGYGILRMTEQEPWTPKALINPVAAAILAAIFQYGVMLHDVEFEKVLSGEKSREDARATLRAGLKKSGKQGLKDYVLWPALTGPSFLPAVAAGATANLVRNLWAFMIIFCGHFPAGVHDFTVEESEGESKGHWYFRQILGSANIDGGKLFHIMSGNLSFQIEHHAFPDIPARRYQQVAGEVKALCERFGLPYNSRGLTRQFGSVIGKITRLALPSKPASVTAEPTGDPTPTTKTTKTTKTDRSTKVAA